MQLQGGPVQELSGIGFFRLDPLLPTKRLVLRRGAGKPGSELLRVPAPEIEPMARQYGSAVTAAPWVAASENGELVSG